jgi:hypothetical protein
MNEDATFLLRPTSRGEDMRHGTMLARNTLAVVLAGGRGSRLYNLTDWRAKPSVPFGGNSASSTSRSPTA